MFVFFIPLLMWLNLIFDVGICSPLNPAALSHLCQVAAFYEKVVACRLRLKSRVHQRVLNMLHGHFSQQSQPALEHQIAHPQVGVCGGYFIKCILSDRNFLKDMSFFFELKTKAAHVSIKAVMVQKGHLTPLCYADGRSNTFS